MGRVYIRENATFLLEDRIPEIRSKYTVFVKMIQQHRRNKIANFDYPFFKNLRAGQRTWTRRFRGDSKFNLEDCIIIAEIFNVDPGDLAFMDPEEFKLKYKQKSG